MRETRYRGISGSQAALAVPLLVVCIIAAVRAPAGAGQKFGPLELSGNLESQNLVRHSSIDKYQFIQNRNTVRIRVDYDWLQNGKLIDKIEIPFIERSKLFLLYRGVYDGFYDIAPTDLQHGQERFDDLVGGPIKGNDIGTLGANGKLLPGGYSRLTESNRTGDKFENVLREAYVDLKLKDLPVSFRIGRQQVIWGESDQFRLMDIWNPIDVTWHLQQESWDNIRVPLWLAKGLWDVGEVGPFSNTFLEVVYNPFDFQPNQKLEFTPHPWAAFFANPLRDGQVQNVLGGYYATRFNLNGTSFRRGDFHRNPQDASEVGARIHAVEPHGIEFSLNYLYARGRGVGAASPLGVDINSVTTTTEEVKAADGTPAQFSLDNGATVLGAPGTPRNRHLFYVDVDAVVKYPYNHIFGFTANYFEGDFTSTIFRLETAYVLGEPVQTIDPLKVAPGAPLGFDKRDVWAGMVGFDRPTWIRWLNSKTTWFLTGQFFWSYYAGSVRMLRGNSGAAETPYFTPSGNNPGSKSQGVGQWQSGPFAGITERLQLAGSDPSGDAIRHWEHLITIAGTSFYRGGTIVPFWAVAIDPVNANLEALYNIDFFYSNDFIITLQQKFFTNYGRGVPSNDPWGAGGRNTRRDETGIKLTYQF